VSCSGPHTQRNQLIEYAVSQLEKQHTDTQTHSGTDTERHAAGQSTTETERQPDRQTGIGYVHTDLSCEYCTICTPTDAADCNISVDFSAQTENIFISSII